MKRQRLSNRVTWASGLNLCQVRLFLAEDSPSKVGAHTQDRLQKKASSRVMHHLNVEEFNELPPGFECQKYMNPASDVSSSITRIGWKCPPKVVIRSEWHVAAGEESHETEVQKFREMRILEAIFPHPAAIPYSPSVSLHIEEEFFDDSLTPVIPFIPVEEEEAPSNMTCELSPTVTQDPISYRTRNTPFLEPASEEPKNGTSSSLGETVDVLLKTVDRSSIDTDLLVKILSDPKMIENLMKGGLAPTVTASIPRLIPPPSPVPVDQPVTKPEPIPSFHMPTHGNLYRTNNEVHRPNQGQSVSNMTNGPIVVPKLSVESEPARVPRSSGMTMHFQPQQGSARISEPNLNLNPNPNPVMDMDYFKNLIRVHGTEKKESPSPNMNYNGNYSNLVQNLEFGQNVERKQVRSKFEKACMYFTSPKGCRNGSICPYQHDMSSFEYYNRGPLDIPVSKRMRFAGEITTGWV